VRELISNNGDISKFVPPEVEKFIKNRGVEMNILGLLNNLKI